MIEEFSIEYLLFLPFVYGLVKGWSKGLIREVIALGSLVLALIGAHIFHKPVYDLLVDKTDETGTLIHIAAYALVFFGIMIALNWTGKLLTKLIETAQLGTANKFLGAVFSSIKWLIITALVVELVFIANARFEWFDSRSALKEYAILAQIEEAGRWMTQGISTWWENAAEEGVSQLKTA
jgi:membrane protein required for colicin V production